MGNISHKVTSTKRNPYRLSILSLVAVAFLITAALPSISSQHTNTMENSRHRSPYRVFGCGDICGISPFNITWHGRLHESSAQYSDTVAGFYYKTNLVITNQGGMQYGQYRLAIKDKATRALFDQNDLPYELIIENFTGTLSIMTYYYPHGPDGCAFFMLGSAESFGSYSP